MLNTQKITSKIQCSIIFEIEQVHHFHQLYWQTMKQPQQKVKRRIVVRIYISKKGVMIVWIIGIAYQCKSNLNPWKIGAEHKMNSVVLSVHCREKGCIVYVHCREEGCIGLNIPDDQEISQGPRDVPRAKPSRQCTYTIHPSSGQYMY